MKPDCLTPEQWSAAIAMSGTPIETLGRMGRGFLECGNCSRRDHLTSHAVKGYLSNGWPKCCAGTIAGGTMNYYANEAAHDRERLAKGGTR